jgi:hypothetical protein
MLGWRLVLCQGEEVVEVEEKVVVEVEADPRLPAPRAPTAAPPRAAVAKAALRPTAAPEPPPEVEVVARSGSTPSA